MGFAALGLAKNFRADEEVSMNAEIKNLNRFEETSLDAEQPKAMVVGIDDLLVKSMAAFRTEVSGEIRALRYAQMGMLVAILLGFAALIVAILTRA